MSDEPGMRLGIDLGGSKIEFIAFDAAGRERLRRRVPTPRNDYRATLAAIHDVVVHSERELGAGVSVGIGTPGSLSRTTDRLRNSNSVCLNGQSKLDRLYENVPQLWSRYVFSDRVDTRLARNIHGDSSGVRGAAWLWDAPGT
jgi:predicted NBD/HSP70 family sugar kinase